MIGASVRSSSAFVGFVGFQTRAGAAMSSRCCSWETGADRCGAARRSRTSSSTRIATIEVSTRLSTARFGTLLQVLGGAS